MKEFLKSYFLYFLIFIALMFLYNIGKSHYIQVGRNQVENEFNNRTLLQEIEFQKQYKIRDDLLEKSVKEKLENRSKYNTVIKGLETKHLKYREKIQLEFQDIKLEISKLKINNKNLKMDLIEAKALNLSLSTVNRNLLSNWHLSDNEIIKNMDKVIKETNAITEQKYIDFINKIDRIKKRKK